MVAATTRDRSEEAHLETVDRLRKDLGEDLTMTAADGTAYRFDGSLLVDGAVKRDRVSSAGWVKLVLTDCRHGRH